MGPLLPLAGAAAVILLLANSSKKKTAVNDGIRTSVSPPTHVTGQSGTQWDVSMVEAPTKPLSEGGAAVMQVVLNDPKIPARPHMVIEYMQVGANKTNRTLVKKGPSTTDMIQRAMSDFGVAGKA